EATYLCNRLDLQYVPQPSYPFSQLKMEDVWVWDKNRPTRMIPRVEVYTSADVTVEELRAEGEEPALTAEALAKRMSDRDRALCATPSKRSPAPRDRRRQHADRLRPVRGRAADRAVPGRDRPAAHERRARRDAAGLRRRRRARRDRALDDGAAARARVRCVRRPLGRGRAARRRPWRLDRRPDPVRRPARGRARPD